MEKAMPASACPIAAARHRVDAAMNPKSTRRHRDADHSDGAVLGDLPEAASQLWNAK
jgi:hypothetical protein